MSITLTAAMRSNLASMQETAAAIATTQQRLATGKKVNTALDNPSSFFTAEAHNARADALQARKDGMLEGIQAIKAASASITTIKKLVAAAQGIIESARSTDAADRANLVTQFNDIRTQIDDLANNDAKYKGTNFLEGDTLTIDFNEDASSSITITGEAATSSDLGIVAATDLDDAELDTLTPLLTDALTTLNTQAATLASNLSIVSARSEFTSNMINIEKEGADNLTLADLNEESANMLALQTRQSLSTTALSLASQSAQSVLRLF